MLNMTLSIPEKLHKEMICHSDLKGNEIARQAFEKKIEELRWIDKILNNSSLTKDETEEIGHQIKQEIRKRFSK